jgi:hypothetical protein
MHHPNLASIPLLGALCVAAGLVSQDDLDTCLALQHQTDEGTPIGQILLLHGYLSAHDLARMVAQQQHIRRAFAVTRGAPAAASAPPEATLADIPLYGVTR